MSESQIHDHAFAGAKCIVEVFLPLLRQEERVDAFAEVYARLKALLERYDMAAERRLRRLTPTPSKN